MKKLITLLACCVVVASYVGTSSGFQLPDTGQTQDYTTTFGEDSDYLINCPSYTKLDDVGNHLPDSATSWVMVKDNNTGLVWEIKTTDGSINDMGDRYDWFDAPTVFIAQLNASNFGGLSNWRMPNPKELLSIRDYGTYGPAINTNYFPNENTQNFQETWAHYWSSTPAIFQDNRAWGNLPNAGHSHDYFKDYPFYVRAVSGAEFTNNFVYNGNRTVIDESTQLMWEQKTDDGGLNDKDNAYTWEEALAWVANLNDSRYLGYDDWRMPNIKELQSIVDFSHNDPATNQAFFPNTKSYVYWSSTSLNNELAWAVWFNRGYVDVNWQYFGGKKDLAHVRAVRSISAASIYSCVGFESPCDNGPVKVKKNRVLPFRAELVDEDDFAITDADIGDALPWIKVMRDTGGTDDPVDVTDDALPAGQGTDGNEFIFSEGKWRYNLKTKNYSSPGTYTVTMESPDENTYIIDPTCTGIFVID